MSAGGRACPGPERGGLPASRRTASRRTAHPGSREIPFHRQVSRTRPGTRADDPLTLLPTHSQSRTRSTKKRRREEPGFRPVRPRHLERTTTDRPERRLMERDLELHRREAKRLLVVRDRDHPVGEIHVIDGSRRVTGERERQEEGSGEPDLIVIAV